MPLEDLLRRMVEVDASDLHLKVGSPPGYRIHGEIVPFAEHPMLNKHDTRAFIEEVLAPEKLAIFDAKGDFDLSRAIPGLARFRVNCYRQRGSCGLVIRRIPEQVPKLEEMGFPPIFKKLCELPRGLVLVTGPTGSGKSTTLAAMIDYINRTESGHILTMEDPIEFVHPDRKSFVNQREVGHDTEAFSEALKRALRQDPDVILVGEMRDLETIGLAITAAETGHLVFGTLHTTSAIQTVDRIVDVFPPGQQQQVRMQLSATIAGVISQTLLKKQGGGRVAVHEILIGTDGVRACVREGKTHMLLNQLQTGSSHGMQTLEQGMCDAVKKGLISFETGLGAVNNPNFFRTLVGVPEGSEPPAVRPAAGTAGPTPTRPPGLATPAAAPPRPAAASPAHAPASAAPPPAPPRPAAPTAPAAAPAPPRPAPVPPMPSPAAAPAAPRPAPAPASAPAPALPAAAPPPPRPAPVPSSPAPAPARFDDFEEFRRAVASKIPK